MRKVSACFGREPTSAVVNVNAAAINAWLATLLWSGKWTNVDIRYCSIGGYPQVDALYGIHFAGLKPWQIKSRSAAHYAKFPDFALWRQFFAAMYWSKPSLHEYPMLKRLWKFCNKVK